MSASRRRSIVSPGKPGISTKVPAAGGLAEAGAELRVFDARGREPGEREREHGAKDGQRRDHGQSRYAGASHKGLHRRTDSKPLALYDSTRPC